MDIFVYSDESGVFDKKHNDIYVYGGVVFLSKDDKDNCGRKYLSAERCIRKSLSMDNVAEIKAANSSNKNKSKLYRSLNDVIKFAVVVNQKYIRDEIFLDKKTKQRYLDYAFKRGIKNCFQHLIHKELIDPSSVHDLIFFADEHSTATNGRYELRESLEQEFKLGTYSNNWSNFHKPLFPGMSGVHMDFCDSANTTLVRAADIVANHVYYKALTGEQLYNMPNNLYVMLLP